MPTRRESLKIMAGTLGALALGKFPAARAATPALLTPEQEQGPFYIPDEHIRRDIREDRSGIPLALNLHLVHAVTGAALPGAAVDIWHCDAAGLYSGFEKMSFGPHPGHGRGAPPPNFPGGPPSGPPPVIHDGLNGPGGPGGHGVFGLNKPRDSNRFLRGVQLSDAAGRVQFTTIYPGWYMGREIHIHVKVHTEGRAGGGDYTGGHICHTGQVFFPDETNLAVSRVQPYAASQTPRTTKATDHVYRDQHGDRAVARMHPGGSKPVAGYSAFLTLAVDPAAVPAPVGMR